MKKIFAIALALVMVLSMASAFAFVGTCGDYAYTCPTVGCGVAKAEVVQFAAVNTVDGFEETACAGVVGGQNLFYGVKVTFDKDVNAQWFEHANTELVIEESNINGALKIEAGQLASLFATAKTAGDVSGKSFWLNFASGDLESDWSAGCVRTVVATNTKAKVCANVEYDFSGFAKDITGGWINYTNFKVMVQKGADTVSAKAADYIISVVKGNDQLDVYVVDGVAKYAVLGTNVFYADKGTVMVYSNATLDATGTTIAVNFTGDAKVAGLACSDVDEMMALININFGSCVSDSVIKAIFGWKNGDAACKTWNSDAKAIVNAECVVAIPKTGDASVLAWLF